VVRQGIELLLNGSVLGSFVAGLIRDANSHGVESDRLSHRLVQIHYFGETMPVDPADQIHTRAFMCLFRCLALWAFSTSTEWSGIFSVLTEAGVSGSPIPTAPPGSS